jgi:ATP-dependent helicase/nuclease subunit B
LADALFSTGCGGTRPAGMGRRMAEDVAAHAAVIRGLSDLGLGDRAASGSTDMASVLPAIAVTLGGEETAGRVQVCDFRAVGARRFDVVILGGLTKNELPQDGRGTLAHELQLEDGSDKEGEPGDQLRLEFYALVTRARRRLYLVRQDADSEGRERRASSLWEDARDVYKPIDASSEGDGPPQCERVSRADIEEFAPALTLLRRIERRSAKDMRMRALDRGVVASPEGLSAIGLARDSSATEVETYLACPYRWFHERVVRPREIDAALDARELGVRAHRLLASFYRRIDELPGRTRVTPEWLEGALELFDDIATADRLEAMAAEGLAEELAVVRAVGWARTVVGQDAYWLPGFACRHVELGFGGEAPFFFGGHALAGRIDRVDVGPESAFVTDYKSSRDVAGVAAFESEAKVQAVVYASAVQHVLGVPVSGSVYRSMRSGKVRGFWRPDLLGGTPPGMCEDDALDAEGFAALVARTEERVGEAIAGMRGGRVSRTPAVNGACACCAISAMCEGARA